jgi:GDP-L-fucose synthase
MRETSTELDRAEHVTAQQTIGPPMKKDSKIFVAGHRGLAGGAILRELLHQGHGSLVIRTHSELDLEDPAATMRFFELERPRIVFLAAAKAGGIVANSSYPVDFLMRNLEIQTSIFRAAHRTGVARLIYLASSCMYPRDCQQPMRETDLLTGRLEPTNQPYAIAKIAGVEMCHAYNRQFATRYLAVTPAALYGPGDSYDPANSHVLPALIRKLHLAKVGGDRDVVLWGTGRPRREFLHSQDMARALIFLAQVEDAQFDSLFPSASPPLINVGSGQDLSIRELAEILGDVIGYRGGFIYDASKPDGMPRKLLDVSGLRALGWEPRIGLREGIAQAYQDFLARAPE